MVFRETPVPSRRRAESGQARVRCCARGRHPGVAAPSACGSRGAPPLRCKAPPDVSHRRPGVLSHHGPDRAGETSTLFPPGARPLYHWRFSPAGPPRPTGRSRGADALQTPVSLPDSALTIVQIKHPDQAATLPLTSSGIRIAGGVLRLLSERTLPSITVMPTPGRLPSCTESSMSLPGACWA